jgi:hypothetical protein
MPLFISEGRDGTKIPIVSSIRKPRGFVDRDSQEEKAIYATEYRERESSKDVAWKSRGTSGHGCWSARLLRNRNQGPALGTRLRFIRIESRDGRRVAASQWRSPAV